MANAVAGPVVRSNEGNKPASTGPMIPWRRATTPRTASPLTVSKTLTAATQPVTNVIDGTGFMTGLNLEIVSVTAGNSAATAYTADGPYAVLDTLSLSDSGGELFNLGGYDLYLIDLYGGYSNYTRAVTTSADTNVYQLTSGAGATGGSFRVHLFVPVAINRRNFLGLLGNQDRGQKYTLRTDIAASTAVYTVVPTVLGSLTINITYENVTVPAPANAAGVAQAQFPSKFGVQHFANRQISPNAPVGGSTVTHQLARLGNTVRVLILVLKSNGSRATAESNLPTRIQFQLGDTPLFIESVQYRRHTMFQRYGFDAPAGVLVYDFITDLIGDAGSELGSDWLWTAGIVNASFMITYPSGFGSTNNTLTVITDDLIIPDNVNVYAPDGV